MAKRKELETNIDSGTLNRVFGHGEKRSYMGDPIPRGRYTLQVSKPSVEVGQNSGDEYVAFTATVLDGEHEGRSFKQRLFLGTVKADGSPSQSLDITRGTVFNILDSVIPDGLASVDENDMLELATAIVDAIDGATFVENVTIEGKAEDEYGQQNRLRPRRTN